MPDQPSWRCVTNLVIWCHSGSQRRPCKSMAGNDEDYGPYQLKQPRVIFVNLLLYTISGWEKRTFQVRCKRIWSYAYGSTMSSKVRYCMWSTHLNKLVNKLSLQCETMWKVWFQTAIVSFKLTLKQKLCLLTNFKLSIKKGKNHLKYHSHFDKWKFFVIYFKMLTLRSLQI